MKNFPFQAALDLQKEEERLETWLSRQAFIQTHYVELEDCISHPDQVVTELAKFLQLDLDVNKAEQVPNAEQLSVKLGE